MRYTSLIILVILFSPMVSADGLENETLPYDNSVETPVDEEFQIPIPEDNIGSSDSMVYKVIISYEACTYISITESHCNDATQLVDSHEEVVEWYVLIL